MPFLQGITQADQKLDWRDYSEGLRDPVDSWERTGILRELFGKVLKEGKTVNSDDYRPQDREGADFVVQGDGAESAEEGEEEDRVVGTVSVVVTVSYTVEGLSAKGKIKVDVVQNNIDKKAKAAAKKNSKDKTTAARKGFVKALQVRDVARKNEDIDEFDPSWVPKPPADADHFLFE